MNQLIAVTGAVGQLGKCVVAELESAGIQYRSFNKNELDVTDFESVLTCISPDFTAVINCAAYTNVDGAESNLELAFAVNEQGPLNIATRCKQLGIRFIHVSTDYVFDGLGDRPKCETDDAKPVTVYGKSKLAGEVAALARNPQNTWVVRTAWLYSNHGDNFAKKILNNARLGEGLKVVDDQIGSPTLAAEVAHGLVVLAATDTRFEPGVYHCVNSGKASWYSFAVELLSATGLSDVKIQPVKSSDFETAAKRPSYSVMDDSKWKSAGLPTMSTWKEAVTQFCLDVYSNKSREQND
jgi:dTDP-4-dehydrorhamnose reductase